MDYIIEEKPSFKIVGLALETSLPKIGETSEVWQNFTERMSEISQELEEKQKYGLCFESGRGADKIRYIACTEVAEFENVPGGMVMAEVEESKYAVFTHKGKRSDLAAAYGKIRDTIKAKKMKSKGFWVECYDENWDESKGEGTIEIWISVE
jgi:AraC family transcriptional regulator